MVLYIGTQNESFYPTDSGGISLLHISKMEGLEIPTSNQEHLVVLENAAQKMFPPGKRYSSLRALHIDIIDWACRFGLQVGDGVDSFFCSQNNGRGENKTTCPFSISFQNTNEGVIVTSDSVYKHSSACACNQRPSESDLPDECFVKLTEPKEFSRLLYTNPVCFLGTKSSKRETFPADFDSNVMVLSWLTATNNEGSFMFSINKNRHSSNCLSEGFILSVPVQGMEDMVLGVGGVSGKWGVSKFPSDHREAQTEKHLPPDASQKKKRRGPKFPNGIPSLQKVPFGCGVPVLLKDQPAGERGASNLWPFAIRGTVAHLECIVRDIVDNAEWIDASHYVVFAKVTSAYVHPKYWNVSKKLFQPSQGYPPYLTFFGSQTFGYVSPNPLEILNTRAELGHDSPTQSKERGF